MSLERRCPLNRGVPKERFHCNNYIDLARAKSEALVNNTCTQKKLKSCNAKRGRQ